MIKFDKTDSCYDIALLIFEKLDVHASVSVYGFEPGLDLVPRGEEVVKELIQLDINKNIKNGKRKRVRAENQIGDSCAQKAFKFKKRIIDNKVRFDIWRIQ